MNIAIINQNGGKYLFEVPESISLKEGEKVKCDTKRGITDGTVWADSITTDEPTAKLIGKLLRAKFPLKSVVGKTVTSVEMFEQPEPKREPVKLYCVEDYEPGEWLTKGKVYEVSANGGVEMDDGYVARYDSVPISTKPFTEYFVPLVSRPAKVGEWVLITADSVDGAQKGEICEVVRANHCSANHMYLRTKKPTVYGHPGITPCALAAHSEYLVLDGYTPEPEKAEPEYYSGKVVCVDSAGYCHTVGKTYTVLDGFLIDDSGTKVPYLTGPVTSVDDLNSRSACKFAVLLGE